MSVNQSVPLTVLITLIQLNSINPSLSCINYSLPTVRETVVHCSITNNVYLALINVPVQTTTDPGYINTVPDCLYPPLAISSVCFCFYAPSRYVKLHSKQWNILVSLSEGLWFLFQHS